MACTKLLVLYTGGTIGMQASADGLAPASGFEARLRAQQALEQGRQLPNWVFRELLPPIDSANMRQANWLAMVAAIRQAVEQDGCDAVLVLHGTDTLAYSAAALSFLLLGLPVPVLLTGSMQPAGVPGSEMAGVILTQTALAAVVGEWGRVFVSIALMLFVFTTLIYNYYLGENALGFFSGKRWPVQVYRVLVIALVLWGSLQDLGTVFAFADVTMGLLAIVNLVALTLLFKVGLRLMRDYDGQIEAGVESPVFDPKQFADLDLDPAAWPASPPKAAREPKGAEIAHSVHQR